MLGRSVPNIGIKKQEEQRVKGHASVEEQPHGVLCKLITVCVSPDPVASRQVSPPFLKDKDHEAIRC